jgi:hypothetical protein
MCGIPQKAVAARFADLLSEVLNKVIHRLAERLQLFSRNQNLAPKLKFYFNFAWFVGGSMRTTMRHYIASNHFFATTA